MKTDDGLAAPLLDVVHSKAIAFEEVWRGRPSPTEGFVCCNHVQFRVQLDACLDGMRGLGHSRAQLRRLAVTLLQRCLSMVGPSSATIIEPAFAPRPFLRPSEDL